MPILKFAKRGDKVVLDKLRMEDITEDRRTALLNRLHFICPKYKIDENVYMAKNDLFFQMARILNTQRVRIDAMIINEEGISIIIVPSRSYVFWNGRSVEPEDYHILQTEENIHLQEQIKKGNVPVSK